MVDEVDFDNVDDRAEIGDAVEVGTRRCRRLK
jgi:hypothetical protein